MALEERTRERVPLDWAMAQNNLGNALARLGGRDGGTARLEEAVAAYRAALEEYTRERVPLQWAMTQNNLGSALLTLGERESGTVRLAEAVAAYRAAPCGRSRPPMRRCGQAARSNGRRISATCSGADDRTARSGKGSTGSRAPSASVRHPTAQMSTTDTRNAKPHEARSGSKMPRALR